MSIADQTPDLEYCAKYLAELSDAARKPLRRLLQIDHHGKAADDGVTSDITYNLRDELRQTQSLRVSIPVGESRTKVIEQLRAIVDMLESDEAFVNLKQLDARVFDPSPERSAHDVRCAQRPISDAIQRISEVVGSGGGMDIPF